MTARIPENASALANWDILVVMGNATPPRNPNDDDDDDDDEDEDGEADEEPAVVREPDE
jgi:hypothetical protein